MKRLLDVSVSILVVIALFMSQSWAVTAAYADYSIDGSDDSNSFHLEGSTSNQAEPISGGQESDAGSVDSEPQDAQQVLSGETNEPVPLILPPTISSPSKTLVFLPMCRILAGWIRLVRVRLPEPRVGA